jgi:hypothetical protein
MLLITTARIVAMKILGLKRRGENELAIWFPKMAHPALIDDSGGNEAVGLTLTCS